MKFWLAMKIFASIFLLFLASSYEFAVNLNDSTSGQIELDPQAILTDISSLLVPAVENLQIEINASEFVTTLYSIYMHDKEITKFVVTTVILLSSSKCKLKASPAKSKPNNSFLLDRQY